MDLDENPSTGELHQDRDNANTGVQSPPWISKFGYVRPINPTGRTATIILQPQANTQSAAAERREPDHSITKLFKDAAPCVLEGYSVPRLLFPSSDYLSKVSAEIHFEQKDQRTINDFIESLITIPNQGNTGITAAAVLQKIQRLQASSLKLYVQKPSQIMCDFTSIGLENPHTLYQDMKNHLINPETYQVSVAQILIYEGVIAPSMCVAKETTIPCVSLATAGYCSNTPTLQEAECRLKQFISTIASVAEVDSMKKSQRTELRRLVWFLRFKLFMIQYRNEAFRPDSEAATRSFENTYELIKCDAPALKDSIIPKECIQSAKLIIQLMQCEKSAMWFDTTSYSPLSDKSKYRKYIDHTVGKIIQLHKASKFPLATFLDMASPFGWNCPEAQYVFGLWMESIFHFRAAGYFFSHGYAADGERGVYGIRDVGWICHLIQRRKALARTYGFKMSVESSKARFNETHQFVSEETRQIIKCLRAAQAVGNSLTILSEARETQLKEIEVEKRPPREIHDSSYDIIYASLDPSVLESLIKCTEFIPKIIVKERLAKIEKMKVRLQMEIENFIENFEGLANARRLGFKIAAKCKLFSRIQTLQGKINRRARKDSAEVDRKTLTLKRVLDDQRNRIESETNK
ncbi:uncharacterized protein BJ171DRAFT_75079 [Polychytrium aggregatum]|uniref:uncharacterized protein n=1 Tax=Polychytrium aggregatum TaxID=110093 RepID=UPI0022FF2CF1|nr:uncharacterized protein BJ171DRAFT_75079 [Polychytrium aggregatum]KAI9205465.1 hypothetical protein BJ171DRAFT_75079 [Polychytrium aggregatum]